MFGDGHDPGCYEKIKALTRGRGRSYKDLLALSSTHDPFYAGRTKTGRKMAEWFANVCHDLGFDRPNFDENHQVHLRRIHYVIVSQKIPIDVHDGEEYPSMKNNWEYLEDAFRYARLLGLVDPLIFKDQRNPKPHDFAVYDIPHDYKRLGEDDNEYGDPRWGIDSDSWNVGGYDDEWVLPSICKIPDTHLDWALPSYEIKGLKYNEYYQPHHLEVWCEKSTMDDILIPLCREYSIVLVTGEGFMSITSVPQFLERIEHAGKPAIVLYICDFDPAGKHMPKAVARQIEYWLKFYDLDLDVKLIPVVLTEDQVQRYGLPRKPITESDRRKKNFEDKNGEGAVELDALEALYPGKLREIVKESILEFRDNDLEDEFDQAQSNLEDNLSEAWKQHVDPYQDNMDEIEEDVREILRGYDDELLELNSKMQDDLKPMKERLEKLRQVVTSDIKNLFIEAPWKPEPEILPNQECYFDSQRKYLDQLQYYKRGW
ncbi:MAG: hypothetical protein MASP_01770 [Candidatus Methanolliviera sp. GoM_asphalt]|nr:MAG: hypothetical protein MASP_01770 [Candidatus Methanolliviera sp. GoM_asphalt]